MSIRGNYEFLFTGKDDSSFLENYVYDFFKEHAEEGGQVFVNLEIQNNPVDAEEIGCAIFETLQGVFFEDLNSDPYFRFENALKEVNGVLNEFKEQKMSGYIGNLNIVIAAVVDNQLFLTQCGDAEAYLIRKRYVSVVSEGLSEDASSSEDVFASIASGEIEAGDFVLFSSSRLLRYVSKNDLAQAVCKAGVVETLNEIRDVISAEILGRIGMIGVLFEEMIVGGEDDVVDVPVEKAERKNSSSGGLFGRKVRSYGLRGKEKVSGFFGRNNKRKPVEGEGFLSVLGGVFVSIFSFFKKSLFSSGFGKDKILALLIIFIVVLFVGVIYANNRQSRSQKISDLDEILVEVQGRIAEAETRGAYDKEAAKMILDRAYMDAKKVLESGHYRDKAGLYLLQIEETRDRLDNVERIFEPKIVADLSSKRSGISALGFAVVRDKLFVYDSNGLYEIVLDQVQDPLTISDSESVVSATGFAERNSILFLTREGNVIEYREGIMNVMNTEDGAFRRGISLLAWGSRIYILDVSEGQIWRYSYKGLREIFGSAEPYLTDSTDISDAVDLAIDANIYLLDNSGGISKFFAGAKQSFYVNDAPFSMFKSPEVIYTNERLDQIFVLDSGDGRIFVYDKESQTGNIRYKAQYVFDDIDELRDIYVDPDSRRVYILTASKIIELE